MGRYLHVLSTPDFRRLWTGATISTLGDGMTFVALSWLVLSRPGGTTQLGLLGICYTAPVLLGGMAVGPLLDRFDKRTMLIADSLLRAVAVASVPLTAALDATPTWLPFAVAAFYGLLKMVPLAGFRHAPPTARGHGILRHRATQRADDSLGAVAANAPHPTRTPWPRVRGAAHTHAGHTATRLRARDPTTRAYQTRHRCHRDGPRRRAAGPVPDLRRRRRIVDAHGRPCAKADGPRRGGTLLNLPVPHGSSAVSSVPCAPDSVAGAIHRTTSPPAQPSATARRPQPSAKSPMTALCSPNRQSIQPTGWRGSRLTIGAPTAVTATL